MRRALGDERTLVWVSATPAPRESGAEVDGNARPLHLGSSSGPDARATRGALLSMALRRGATNGRGDGRSRLRGDGRLRCTGAPRCAVEIRLQESQIDRSGRPHDGGAVDLLADPAPRIRLRLERQPEHPSPSMEPRNVLLARYGGTLRYAHSQRL